ncbi:MAG: tRNA uridine-5-carboxymethylaminomethyl(34) synthesis GTPase MnmE [Deltaproteobacteria bacterium]|nr:tRNA uridine-5-carboxymethylaminomethyl(34) synthesis GTPase MnmE [Deltaproteobacteria bacterium]RLB32917.1 MAG: tRNA uridine-5-carboxymethylaminomethyl(34) synthesis GTPase MnmE [Deltaproteobacteria bacterium]
MIQNGSSEDTIAAIATPVGQAGIGIIRISGPRSLEIARKVFCPKKDIQTFESHRLYLGHVKDPASGRVLDEVLISFMKAPHTYTREDVVEINCHSGYLLLARVLEIILNQGARLAKPGEFTYRAFMNNRIDLTQAEAVVDLINSHSERGLQLASEQIKGGLRTQIRELREKALEILASIEVAIDFPDEEVEFLPRDKTADKIEGELIEPIEKILAAYVQRKIWMEGIRTVIVGRVNAGKSSLLNRLLNEERAIVTPIPGTTRDVIESTIYIEGLPLRLIDTAGFRKVKGRLEGIGIRLTHKKWAEADLALVVIDQSRPVNRDDLDLISKSREKKSLILLNKSDLPGKISEERLDGLLEGLQVVRISALTGEGIDDLRRAIRDLILSPDTDIATSLSVAPNLRHKQALQKAGQFFKTSAQNARNGLPLEIIAMDINSALEALAEITGEITTDDLLDKIFSQFCLGK